MNRLSENDKKNIFDYLRKYSNFNESFYLNMKDAQLFAVYNSFRERRESLINKLLSINPKTGRAYTFYDRKRLNQLSLNELKDILTSSTKKISSSPIIDEEENDDDREYSFLTPDELSMIYGVSVLDLDSRELEKAGYKVIEENRVEKIIEVKDELRKRITGLILDGGFKDKYGNKYTAKRLEVLSLDELCFLYNFLTVKLDDYDTAEQIEFEERLKRN